jgi:hypothetical protein
LGTVKHIFTIGKNFSVLNDGILRNIPLKVDALKAPADIGQQPAKISSGFSQFNAQEWKCVYSLFALKGLVEDAHLDFVKSCTV